MLGVSGHHRRTHRSSCDFHRSPAGKASNKITARPRRLHCRLATPPPPPPAAVKPSKPSQANPSHSMPCQRENLGKIKAGGRSPPRWGPIILQIFCQLAYTACRQRVKAEVSSPRQSHSLRHSYSPHLPIASSSTKQMLPCLEQQDRALHSTVMMRSSL